MDAGESLLGGEVDDVFDDLFDNLISHEDDADALSALAEVEVGPQDMDGDFMLPQQEFLLPVEPEPLDGAVPPAPEDFDAEATVVAPPEGMPHFPQSVTPARGGTLPEAAVFTGEETVVASAADLEAAADYEPEIDDEIEIEIDLDEEDEADGGPRSERDLREILGLAGAVPPSPPADEETPVGGIQTVPPEPEPEEEEVAAEAADDDVEFVATAKPLGSNFLDEVEELPPAAATSEPVSPDDAGISSDDALAEQLLAQIQLPRTALDAPPAPTVRSEPEPETETLSPDQLSVTSPADLAALAASVSGAMRAPSPVADVVQAELPPLAVYPTVPLADRLAPEAREKPAALNKTPTVEAARIDAEQWRTALGVVEAEIALERGSARLAALHFEAGRCTEHLGEAAAARKHYQSAVRLSAHHLPAIRGLQRCQEAESDWEGLVHALDVEIAASQDPRTIGLLQIRKGRVLEERAESAGEAPARVAYESARSGDGEGLAATTAMAQLAYRHGELPRFAAARRAELELQTDARGRSAVLTELAALLELVDADPEAAAQRYQEAADASPSVVATAALARGAARRGDAAAESKALESLAAMMTVPSTRSRVLYVAAMAARRGADEETFTRLLELAREAQPSAPVLAALAESGTGKKAEVLQALAGSLDEGPGRAEIHYELARALHTVGEAEAAQRELERALEMTPHHLPARQLQLRLYDSAKRYDALAGAWDAAGQAATGAIQADWLCLAAVARERYLDDSEGAVETYARAVAVAPAHGFALDGCRRLWTDGGRLDRLARAVYSAAEAHAASAKEDDGAGPRACDHFLWAGRLFERVGGDDPTSHGATAYGRALELAPRSQEALAGLLRLQLASGDNGAVAETTHRLAEVMSDCAPVAQELHRRSGEALAAASATEGGTPEQAAAAAARLRQAALLDPMSPLAALAYERRLTATGGHEALLELRDAQIAALGDPADEATARTIGAVQTAAAVLLEGPLERADEALERYRAGISAGYLDAFLGAKRLLAARGEWSAFVDTAEAHAKRIDDAPRSIAALMEAANVAFERADDATRAGALFRAAHAADPGARGPRRALLELLAQQDDTEPRRAFAQTELDSLKALGEQAPAGQLVPAMLQLGRALAAIPGREAEAIAVAEECLEAHPDNPRALRLLEILGARTGSWETWARAQARLGMLFDTPVDTTSYRLGVATAMEVEALTLDGLEPPMEAYRQAMFLAPDNNGIHVWLYWLARQADNREVLAEVLDRMAASSRGGLGRAALLTRLGSLRALLADTYDAGSDDSALLWTQSLDAEITYLPAIKRLRLRAEATGDEEGLRRWSEAEGAASRDPHLSARAWFTAGSLAEKAGDLKGSRVALQRALEQIPSHDEAFATLMAQLEDTDDSAGLRDALSVRARAITDPKARRELLVRLGHLQRQRLRDVDGAITSFKQVLDIDPDDVEALGDLSELLFEAQRWHEAAAVSIHLIKQSRDASQQAAAFFRLGLIYETHLPDLDRAIQSFDRAMRQAPEPHLEAIKHLVNGYANQGNFDAAVEIGDHLIAVEPNPAEQVRHHLLLAQLHEERRGDPKSALLTIRRALQIDQGNLDALEALASHFERAGNARARQMELDRAAQIYRSRIRREPVNVSHYRGLFRLLSWAGRRKQLESTAAVLDLFGARDPDIAAAVPMAAPENAPIPDATPLLGDDLEQRWGTGAGVVASALGQIGPYLGKVAQIDTARFGVGRGDRVDSGPPRTLLEAAAASFGLQSIELYSSQSMPHLAIAMHPNVLVFGAGILHGGTAPQLRFLAARVLYLLRRGAWVLPFITGDDFGRILTAAATAGGVKVEAEASQEPVNRAMSKALPRRTRKDLGSIAMELSARAGDAKQLQFRVVSDANHVGMVMCGGVRPAALGLARFHGVQAQNSRGEVDIGTLLSVAEIAHLFSYAVSEEHQMMRGVVGMR